MPSNIVVDVGVKADDQANWGLTVCELTVDLDSYSVHALLCTSVKCLADATPFFNFDHGLPFIS